MTQKDKELLLKDLCARLPNNIKVLYTYFDSYEMTIKSIDVYYMTAELICEGYKFTAVPIGDFKPYLRPMSSMTREELHELQEILGPNVEFGYNLIDILDSSIHVFSLEELQAVFEWLNSHHFDYCGLIDKGLALEAPDKLYVDTDNSVSIKNCLP